jgi:Cu2+-exporting ATPase
MGQALNLNAGALNIGAVSSNAEVLKSTTLVVENMHCGACMRRVEQTLTAMPGVVSARVNLSSKRVVMHTDMAPPTVEPYLAALADEGYTATLLADARPNAATDHDFLKRLGVAGFAAANIMLMSVSVWSGHASDMPASLQSMFHWLSALIAIPAVAYAGQPFFSSARQALAAGRFNMDVPISLGVLLATGMSLFQTFRGSEQVYFDAAITLLFFLLIGRALDQHVRTKAASAAENLLGLRSPAATIIHADGRMERIATDAIETGNKILIAAGERVPVDARVVSRTGSIDESLITGESLPRDVAPGDRLYAGTIALSGPIEAEATAVAENTLLSEIARLMHTAEQARGRYVRLADRAARLYAPAVHILGLATFLGWLQAGHGWEAALTSAIAVLIITCPCALALAVPAVQVVATGRLFRGGIVLKASDGLERLAEIDTIVLDKTGTLTLGRPQLVGEKTFTSEQVSRAAGLASQSRHPYAKAVVEAARRRGCEIIAIPGTQEIPGEGMTAIVDGRCMKLGSAHFCEIPATATNPHGLWFCDGENPPLAMPMFDPVRTDANATVANLAKAGYRLEILSGDQIAAVGAVARDLGIEAWYGETRPEQKMARIHELASEGRKVLMIGDGLNDAPALAGGHASMSPSSAADISQTAADAVFQGELLDPVIETLTVAKAARQRSLENLGLAIGYNALFVPLAMAGLITPLIAAIAMSTSSIVVTANALRLGRSTRRSIS